MRAALELWTERGFENGVEETTVEEIVKAAGVTKGTFYFHFARKEEILLEMGWETAALINDEAERCVKAGRNLEESLNKLIMVLTGRMRAAPPASVARAISEFQRQPKSGLPETRPSFGTGFKKVFERAQEVGELPSEIEAFEMAKILQALVMDAILDWTASHTDLRATLRSRSSILVAGLRQPAVLP